MTHAPPEREVGEVGTEETSVEATPRRVRTWRVVVSLVVGVGLVVGVLPRVADLADVWLTLRELSPGWGLLLLASAAWNIATYQFVMMSALPGLSMRRAFVAGQLSTAISNTVPAGAIVGVGVTYTVLRSFGHGSGAIAIAAAVTGVWNTFAKLGLPVVALALLALGGDATTALAATAAVGLAILIGAVTLGALALSRESMARRIGEVAGRALSRVRALLRRGSVDDLGGRLARFQQRSSQVLRERWPLLTGSTLISHLSLYLVLIVSLRAVGVDADQVTAVEAFGAFAFVRIATALPITPGGLGVVELGLTAALVVGGGDEAPVVAGVLLYRSLTYVLQVVLGAASWVVWRRQTRRIASG